jgi:hypothetical protein
LTYHGKKGDINGIDVYPLLTNGGMIHLNHGLVLTGGYFINCQRNGDLGQFNWLDYKWNGSNWVLSTTTPTNNDCKITHGGAENLIHGLTVSFAAGAFSPSFLVSEHYVCMVCRGVYFDTLMSGTLNWTHYVNPVI